MVRPVAASAFDPEAKNSLRLAPGVAVLFPVGDACQTKFWFSAAPPFKKLLAVSDSFGDAIPAVVVATPSVDSVKLPRCVVAPLISRVLVGAVVRIPIKGADAVPA
jgi:hypothetical protein